VLKPVVMNSIYFGAKRVFHGFLRITRKPFQSNELTAARFDLMYLVHEHYGAKGGYFRPLLQNELWRALGVTPSVVCRMLRSLEGLGLVRRRVPDSPYRDRRQREVTLTRKGKRCFREAYRMMVRWVQGFVYEAICYGEHRDPGRRFEHMDRLESYQRVLREHTHDTAELYYAWGHPDD
jgi:DNA-binding MarR family transcriptional regulator